MTNSYDVHIWTISRYQGKRKTTNTVRWSVAGTRFQRTFDTRKLAETFRAKLLTAAREGIPFDSETGLPTSMGARDTGPTWYEHACSFVDMKWPHAAPRQRRSIAEALTDVTLALLQDGQKGPSRSDIRHVLYTWSFNATARKAGPASAIGATARWIAANSVRLTDLADAALVRRALDALALTQNGKPAASTTIARKRAVFYGTLRYAVELEILPANPIDRVQWKTPKSTDAVDRRVVVNPTQVRRLLGAAREIDPHLEAFFACMYYAALRPAEALHLRDSDCKLPEDGWGELILAGSTQQGGTAWGDSGLAKDHRELKHRAKGDIRAVPACPDLARILRHHVQAFGTGPDGRLFVTRIGRFGRPIAGPYGTTVSTNTYTRVWRKARELALTEEGPDNPLARRPYDLRHAGVSLWLNAGVPATQVAEWAGHSVNVLLRVYAKCIYGQDEAARRRIEAALREDERST